MPSADYVFKELRSKSLEVAMATVDLVPGRRQNKERQVQLTGDIGGGLFRRARTQEAEKYSHNRPAKRMTERYRVKPIRISMVGGRWYLSTKPPVFLTDSSAFSRVLYA
ncbi:hypothetical protein GWI33_015497 [Rhynchophorus ferrugineus]|uniref:Uncharacterized protein n=1 Tax=Rhynchophorus ferrugineus TaxID=354439 RepID=A0A834M5Y0_RHYFE|nr:hypothetical protein GWI33_015497 [Rhynchophorus ferrugineus]